MKDLSKNQRWKCFDSSVESPGEHALESSDQFEWLSWMKEWKKNKKLFAKSSVFIIMGFTQNIHGMGFFEYWFKVFSVSNWIFLCF